MKVTNGNGVERAFDASASDPGRQLAIRATREWGRIAFVGEGGTCTFNPSPDIIHGQKTIYGSWVTSLWRMGRTGRKTGALGEFIRKMLSHGTIPSGAGRGSLQTDGKWKLWQGGSGIPEDKEERLSYGRNHRTEPDPKADSGGRI